jgi:hypothetical protein
LCDHNPTDAAAATHAAPPTTRAVVNARARRDDDDDDDTTRPGASRPSKLARSARSTSKSSADMRSQH